MSVESSDKPKIGITLGDPNGIGPEVVIKALADNRIFSLFTPVVYGSARVLAFYRKQLNLEEFNYSQVKPGASFFPRSINVMNCWEETMEITPGIAGKTGGKAALLALTKAVEDMKAGRLDALVTAPIDKSTIHNDEFPFRGHTEYLTKEFNAGESLMILAGQQMKVALVTEHLPLKEVGRFITRDRVELKIRLFELALKKDFGIQKPKIAVLGLNPHAGDEGLIGTEENDVIKPVIADLKSKGKLVVGPFPADGFFAAGQYAKFDGVLAMYHDQGLVAFKALDFAQGVNFTAGLPIVRTSPDHGTAYPIAGKNLADEGSMRQAIYLACDIVRQRSQTSPAT